jgi:cytochrome c oxidase subunit 2
MTTTVLVVIAIVLFALVIFQLAKTTEFVAILRGEEKTHLESDRINSRLMMVFLILGMIALFWSLDYFMEDMVLHAASVHGEWIDSMFNWTLFFTVSLSF